MTSRPLSDHGTTPGDIHGAGPGDRPHLPPVGGSATSRRSDRKAPLAWLPWLLLGLLALTLLGAALLAKAAGGSSDSASSGSRAESTSGGSGDTSAAAPQGGSGDASGASLSAGGQDLLGLAGGSLKAVDGQRASGTSRVESVVADEGFWVGSDATRRVFVFLTPEARRSAGESGFQVEAGQTVQLSGTVKAASAEFAQAAGVTDAEGAAQLVKQGGYVEATEVRLAQ